MRETRADTTRAFAFALALHVLLFGFLLFGMWWTKSSAPAGAAGAVAADVMDASALSASMQRALRSTPETAEPLPAPLPEPEPEAEETPVPEPEPVPEVAPPQPQPKPQDLIPEPDTENREAVVEQPTPKPAVEKKPQEAKRKQEQVDLTEERERQLEAQRQQREKDDTEKRIAEVRRKRAAAAREAQLAEQRLQQLADARTQTGQPAEDAARADAAASAPPGAGGSDDGLKARYAAAMQAAITEKWTRPDSIPPGALCRLVIRQLPGGEVVSAEVSSPCSYDEQGRRSIEAAVLKAQPLPYAGFERVFQRTVTLNFRAPE
ncbi:cell envelope integrity protein TolA [Lysobacter korlensis]|uniref:Cell envelope integrity protein TolA n=1 Tax=Lysobacter korlensis TaxID=553636 RepID=A0ABV6RSF4_9GAMM